MKHQGDVKHQGDLQHRGDLPRLREDRYRIIQRRVVVELQINSNDLARIERINHLEFVGGRTQVGATRVIGRLNKGDIHCLFVDDLELGRNGRA